MISLQALLYLVLIGIYALCLGCILILSFGRFFLTLYYSRSSPIVHPEIPEEWPIVTIQLPVYNEVYVVERLIKCISRLDYPQEKLQIQILDDSTDETTALIKEIILRKKAKGFWLEHLYRKHNTGFKAGALEAALPTAQGEFIAIFDSDFLPHPDFLKRLIPHFHHPDTGWVQAGWEHLNEKHSALTKMQAFGLDAHFSVEQGGRYAAGLFLNFNGTAGIWRKSCITAAGGWQQDTLTEDLDLSYRAQLLGWKGIFVEEVKSPAELPVAIDAVKSQQYRWTKGSVETLKKLLGKISGASISGKQRLFALLHLSNPLIFPMVFISALLSVPLLWVKYRYPQWHLFFQFASVFIIGFLILFYFHWKASGRKLALGAFMLRFFSFITLSSGLAYHNTKAVFSSLVGQRSPFVRTPKFGLRHSIADNKYLSRALPSSTFIELLLCLYFSGAIALGIYLKDYGLIPFHLMAALGYGTMAGYSIQQTVRQ